MLFVFDEISNAPLDVLKALYDIFREPVVTTFSDGKDRIMSNVTMVLTGNVGEEVYEGLPKDLPDWQRMKAMQNIYQRLQSSPELQRQILSTLD